MRPKPSKIPYDVTVFAVTHGEDTEPIEDDGLVHPWPRYDLINAMAHHKGWTVNSSWRSIGGRAAPYQIIVSRDDDGEIFAGAVRRLPLGEMLAASRQQIEIQARRRVEALDRPAPRKQLVDERFGWKAFAEPGPQRGRPLTEAGLQAVAAVYRDAWERGLPLTAAVADAAGVSRSTAAKRIMAARAAGLLEGVGPKR